MKADDEKPDLDETAEAEANETGDTTAEQDAVTTEETAPEEPLTLEEEVLKWRDAALRSSAELDNYRKRMAREKADSIRYANQRLLEELLPVLDNFEMGMQAAQNEQDSMIYMGMSMVQKQLADFFDNLGVNIVKVEGEFDPTVHEAVAEEVSADVPAGHIVRVMRRGFELNGRLLRPATVVVAKSDDGGETTDSE